MCVLRFKRRGGQETLLFISGKSVPVFLSPLMQQKDICDLYYRVCSVCFHFNLKRLILVHISSFNILILFWQIHFFCQSAADPLLSSLQLLHRLSPSPLPLPPGFPYIHLMAVSFPSPSSREQINRSWAGPSVMLSMISSFFWIRLHVHKHIHSRSLASFKNLMALTSCFN